MIAYALSVENATTLLELIKHNMGMIPPTHCQMVNYGSLDALLS